MIESNGFEPGRGPEVDIEEPAAELPSVELEVLEGGKTEPDQPLDLLEKSFRKHILSQNFDGATAAIVGVTELSNDMAEQLAEAIVADSTHAEGIIALIGTIPEGKQRDNVIEAVAMKMGKPATEDGITVYNIMAMMHNKFRYFSLKEHLSNVSPHAEESSPEAASAVNIPEAEAVLQQFQELVNNGDMAAATQLVDQMGKLSFEMKGRQAVALAQNNGSVQKLDAIIWSQPEYRLRVQIMDKVIPILLQNDRFKDADTLVNDLEYIPDKERLKQSIAAALYDKSGGSEGPTLITNEDGVVEAEQEENKNK